MDRVVRGEISPGVALAQLLLRHRTVEASRTALANLGATAPGLASVARRLRHLLEQHGEGSERAAAILAGADAAAGEPASPEEGIERCRRLFDWAAGISPEASVALYSLGDPLLLAEATEEAVAHMERIGVVAPDRHVLDLGCGIGRFERALAGRVAAVTGIDVSAAMIAEARRRCAGLANVRLLQTSGRDLQPFGDAAFDAVIAVDSFPYLYRAGGRALVAAHVRECHRVLREGGDLLLFNLSYAGDLRHERAEAQALADETGFGVLCNGTADLATWDGRAFHFRKGRSRRP
ncbi:class I SAM-dependent methyltransferase [Benzoatithermus flavus]|uniref:Class I SAM-dependent methyltransferase n=1 Tax=Benzoatithermus flavus TaxID=3108223 RepID=A0ABU8XS86_9PROT